LKILKQLFRYNWEVRNEWFALCHKLPQEELLRERIGGVGSILKTLFHIVDVEYSWIKALEGEMIEDPDFNDYMSLELVEGLSNEYQIEVERFLEHWKLEMEDRQVTVAWSKEIYTYGEVLRHVIAHEIHHIGQLSIWSKELGMKAVSANFIGRGMGND
jgi:uncharacterized damage-inducible protein DinB